MNCEKPGTRVLAIRNADSKTVYAFGYGIYLGDLGRPQELNGGMDEGIARTAILRGDSKPLFDHLPWLQKSVEVNLITEQEAIDRNVCLQAHEMADRLRPMEERIAELLYDMSLNPKIALDSGGVVWGCECWWKPLDEDGLAEFAQGREVIMVDAPHYEQEEERNE